MPARLLAVADAYRTMIEPRPPRATRSPEEAARAVGEAASAGRIDAEAVAAVLEAAGAAVPRMGRPAGLTDREAQVISMVAKGLQTKQVGHRLGISAKSADRHLQNAYAKMGVSTRAAAALLPCSTASPPGENSRYRIWASVPSVDLRRTAFERVPKPGGRHGSQP